MTAAISATADGTTTSAERAAVIAFQPRSTAERVAAIVEAVAALHGVSGHFTVDEHLVDRGMTSMAMVDLMLSVEADFDVTVAQRDLTPYNFRSIGALTRLLERL